MRNALLLRDTDQKQTLPGTITLPEALTTPLMPSTQLQAPFTQSLACGTRRRAVTCQVRDCGVQVTELDKAYCARKHICPTHLTADSVLLDAAVHGDEEYRSCHQCGKLEPLTQFDGSKRSCRTRLWQRRKHCSTGSSRKRANKVDPDEEETDDRDYAPNVSSRRTVTRVPEAAAGAPAAKRGKPRAAQSQQRNKQQEATAVVDSTLLQSLEPVPFLVYGVDRSSLAAPAALADAANQQQQPAEPANGTAESNAQSPALVDLAPEPGPEQQPSAVHAPAAAGSRHCDSASAQTVLEQDQTSGAQQQHQQSEYKSDARPAASTIGNELQLGWCYAWDAATDEATSTADDDIDAQLLMQLELVLCDEEQQQQQLVSRQPVVAGPADETGPCATACHDAWGLVTNANPCPADSGISEAAVTVAAAAVSPGTIGSAYHNSAAVAAAASGDQPAPHNKMELVNQLVDAWYDDAGAAEECEGIDAIAQHLEQQILGQVNIFCNNAAGAAGVPAASACHAAQSAGAGAAASASATHSQVQGLTESPVSALQQYPINPRDSQQQIQPSGVFGNPAHSATAGPTACSTMRVTAPEPATSAPAVAIPATAAAAKVSAVGRLVMLQRRVQEMSSQLAQLHNAMQKSVEDFVMTNPPVQSQVLTQHMMGQQMRSQQAMLDHVPAGMLTQQMPDHMWPQFPTQSTSSVATTLDHAALGFRQPQQAGVWV